MLFGRTALALYSSYLQVYTSIITKAITWFGTIMFEEVLISIFDFSFLFIFPFYWQGIGEIKGNAEPLTFWVRVLRQVPLLAFLPINLIGILDAFRILLL